MTTRILIVVAQNPPMVLKSVTNPRHLTPAISQHITLTSQQDLGKKLTSQENLTIGAKFFKAKFLMVK